MHYFFLWASFFFGTYGFKIYGAIDLMVVVPVVILGLIYFGGRNKINAPYVLIGHMLFLLVIMTLFLFVFNFNENVNNLQYFARTLRGTISGICLFFIIYFLASSGKVTSQGAFFIIALVFIAGSGSVVVQAVLPSVQPYFAEIWGFDKHYRPLRGFGLTTGYDTAGYLLSWFSSVALYIYLKLSKKAYLIVFIFVAISILFTSRSSMVLFFILMPITYIVGVGFKSLLSGKLIFISLFVGCMSYYFVFPLVFNSINSDNADVMVLGQEVSSRFAQTNVEDVASKQYILPDTVEDLIFGTGKDPEVDPGYIIIINHGGILVLLLFLFYYLAYYFWAMKKVSLVFNKAASDNQLWLMVWRHAFSMIMLILIVGNFKNLYFYTRGYHELFVMISAMLLGVARQSSKESNRLSETK